MNDRDECDPLRSCSSGGEPSLTAPRPRFQRRHSKHAARSTEFSTKNSANVLLDGGEHTKKC